MEPAVMNVMDAAYNVVSDYPGGSKSLAPRIGKSSTTLSHEITATGSAKLGLETAVKITDLSGDDRILEAWAAHRGKLLMALPTESTQLAGGCLERLSGSSKEFSEMCCEVAGGMSDNYISDNELDRIVKEGSELVASAYALMLAARVNNLAGKNKQQGGR